MYSKALANLVRIAPVLGALFLATGGATMTSGTVAASASVVRVRPVAPTGNFGGTTFAPAAISDCPTNWACGFAKKDYAGGFGMWQGTNSNLNAFDSQGACFYESDGSGTAGMFNTGSWNDCISSAVNHLTGTESITWYANSGCPGDGLIMGNGDTFQNLANRMQSNGNSWDDVISSDRVDMETC